MTSRDDPQPIEHQTHALEAPNGQRRVLDSSTLAELCETLRSEPLWAIGLGSKELFHSNFLAWFADSQPDAARDAFAPWTLPDPHGVHRRAERERRNLDLVLRLAGLGTLVIENKTFSPPDEEQLTRYDARARELGTDAVPASLTLLSLGNAYWSSQNSFETAAGAKWYYRSYADLAEAVDRGLHLIRDRYEADTVRRYHRIVLGLDLLAQAAIPRDHSEPVHLDEETRSALHTIRIDDGLMKLRARAIANRLNQTVEDAGIAGASITTAFTRGDALIEGSCAEPNGDQVGWQYQHKQWRLFVNLSDDSDIRGTGKEHRREDYVRSAHADWFDFEGASHVLDDKRRGSRAGTNGFNHFNPGFVYQYRPVRDLTISELIELGVATLRRTAVPSRIGRAQRALGRTS